MERVVTPPFPDSVGDPTVAGVVLAAGRSERFGDADKLLADHDGRPLVAHAIETLRESAVDSVTVVVRSDRVREVARECGAATVDAPEGTGQSASVRTGVDAVRADADAVLVALGDMPEVGVDTVNALVAAYCAGVADALAAGHYGRRGNPVLFDARFFDALTELDGDQGGRSVLLDADDPAIVDTGDPGTRYDVDRPSDR